MLLTTLAGVPRGVALTWAVAAAFAVAVAVRAAAVAVNAAAVGVDVVSAA
jgi:hypothetical protein